VTGRKQDLLDRLAAADPVRGEEPTPVDEPEADELLARILATGRAEARPRLRRSLQVAAVAAGLLSAILLVIALVDSDSPRGSVVEKAVAATTNGDAVYHVAERFSVRYTTPDRRVLRAFDFEDVDFFRDETTFSESWYVSAGRSRHLTFAANGRRRGRLLYETSSTRSESRQYDARANRLMVSRVRRAKRPLKPPPRARRDRLPQLNPGQDPGPQLRELQRRRSLSLAGTAEVRGRRAYRLTSETIRGPERGHTERIEFLVDAETYLPLVQRSFSTQTGISGLPPELRAPRELYDVPVHSVATRTFLVYEKLPPTRRNLAQLKLRPHPGAKVFDPRPRPRR
jgi:hypothetical protein